ncbi:MAG TPA: HAMP domain-containing sensor histidine kinase [Acidobacteriaceae bacterium]
MRSYSIARRVVLLFLLIEICAALCMTGFVFLYERHTHFRSLDVALRGHADTLMGAVVDANDVDDRVVLNLPDVHVPPEDRYEVWDNGGEVLGRTPGWAAPENLLHGSREISDVSIAGVAYRVVRVEALRTVDPEASGVRHHVVVIYGSPALAAWLPVMRAVRAFVIASSLLLGLSAMAVTLLVRRSMGPLQDLASEAGLISSSRWRFAPPENAERAQELAPLVVALRDLVARLQVSFDQQRQFVSDSAHELKTAVTVVKSSLQLMEMRERTPREYQAGVTTSLAGCLRMEDLVQRMLMLARIEEAEQVPSAGPVLRQEELIRGAREAVAALEPLARLSGITVACEGVAPLDAVIAPEDWQTLCNNLLLNAIQHSRPGSRVLIRMAQEGGRAVCRVKDQGAGIAAAALPHVFDRFFRSDASRARATGGSGLGLAICRAVVERVGGRLSIVSTEGVGTEVTVDLALAARSGSAAGFSPEFTSSGVAGGQEVSSLQPAGIVQP